MDQFGTVVSEVVATTTHAVWTVISTGMPLLWTFLIAVGAVLMIAGAIVGIFFKRKRRGRRR